VQLGLINIVGTSNKALMALQKYKSKNPKKKHPHHNNKKNKGTKPSQPTSNPNGDKGEKSKSNNTTDRHCNFCGKDGHVESKCFKKMESLEEAMKKHNINIESFPSSHGHALSTSGFSFNSTSTSSSDENLIDYGSSYHMDKDKAIFFSLNQCNTKKTFIGDDRSLSVVGSGTIQVDNGQFNDGLCVSIISYNLLSMYHITHLGGGKIVEFSPHQVVIND
jgi:hypothetical protein